MNAEKTAIKVLAATAALLLLALVFVPRPATAQVAAKDGDYCVCSYPSSKDGNDVLYVAETRAYGSLVVFQYNHMRKELEAKAIRKLDDAFGGR